MSPGELLLLLLQLFGGLLLVRCEAAMVQRLHREDVLWEALLLTAHTCALV